MFASVYIYIKIRSTSLYIRVHVCVYISIDLCITNKMNIIMRWS